MQVSASAVGPIARWRQSGWQKLNCHQTEVGLIRSGWSGGGCGQKGTAKTVIKCSLSSTSVQPWFTWEQAEFCSTERIRTFVKSCLPEWKQPRTPVWGGGSKHHFTEPCLRVPVAKQQALSTAVEYSKMTILFLDNKVRLQWALIEYKRDKCWQILCVNSWLLIANHSI